MTRELHPLDLAVLLAYGGVLLYLGFRLWRRGASTADDYFIAGRSLTLPAFVMTLVTTWYGGILGVGEYTYRYGIANWFVFGLPYYLGAALFALFFAKKARRTRFKNLPDQLYQAYGARVSRAGALLVFVLTLPAGYVLMLGITAVAIFDVDLTVGVILGTVVSVGYVYLGGMRAVIRTDRFQFILMYGGFVVLLIFLWMQEGSPISMWSRLPDTHTDLTGGQSIWAILVWYFIALGTLIDPTFYQRCYAARDEDTARRGIWFAIGFWFFFDVMTTLVGLYAAAIYVDLANPVTAFPQLAIDYLPIGVRGLFWVTLWAVIMSTVDSYTFTAAVTAGRDLWLGPEHSRGDAAEIRMSRRALPLVAVLAIVLALYFRSVVDIWYVIGSVITPALLLPVVVSFSNAYKFSPAGAMLNMIAAGGVSLTWEIMRNWLGADALPWAVPAIYPGLAVSIIIWGVDRSRMQKTSPVDLS